MNTLLFLLLTYSVDIRLASVFGLILVFGALQKNIDPKSTPFVSFFRRYWILVLLFGIALDAASSDWLFGLLGTVIYLPVMAVGSVVVALLIRHLFFSQTLDLDVASGLFVASWQAMDSRSRVVLNLAASGVLFLGICHIAAALIK